jgi:hypothetical protein
MVSWAGGMLMVGMAASAATGAGWAAGWGAEEACTTLMGGSAGCPPRDCVTMFNSPPDPVQQKRNIW